MFIDWNLESTVRGSEGRNGSGLYLSGCVPPLRTAPECLGPTSYIHVTPRGVKTPICVRDNQIAASA